MAVVTIAARPCTHDHAVTVFCMQRPQYVRCEDCGKARDPVEEQRCLAREYRARCMKGESHG